MSGALVFFLIYQVWFTGMIGWAIWLAIKTRRHNQAARRAGMHHYVIGPF